MDKSSINLRDTLKKIPFFLKPQHGAVALTLLVGRSNQGKTALLSQSQLEQVSSPAPGIEIFFNQQGIFIELNERIVYDKSLLNQTLKQIQRAHRHLTLTGVLMCLDMNEILTADPVDLKQVLSCHTELLTHLADGIGAAIDFGLVCTKLDLLSGFCDFFQQDHASDLQKPLGFSLQTAQHANTSHEMFKTQFDQLIIALGQQVIHKIHPIRSSNKRTLIREFPLQLASLGQILAPFISRIPPLFRVEALYFTSSEQGGMSTDWLNKKIKRDYALTLHDQAPLSTNYRAYFTQGALENFQSQTKTQPPRLTQSQRYLLISLIGLSAVCLALLGYRHFHASRMLDKTSQELIALDNLDVNGQHKTALTLHLAKATQALMEIPSNSAFLPTIQSLKNTLSANHQKALHDRFLPSLNQQIEQVMLSPSASPVERYNALKIYLMFKNPKNRVNNEIIHWFQTHWQSEHLSSTQDALRLLKQVLVNHPRSLPTNQQHIIDTRNFLNALPASYLYYSLAKSQLNQSKMTLDTHGFHVSQTTVPMYLTKSGFQTVIHDLPNIVKKLKHENWVLARQDLSDLPILLQQAYCYEYVLWWQHWIQSIRLQRSDDEVAYQMVHRLRETNAFNTMIRILQQQTGADTENLSPLFNQEIASKFSELNLISDSSLRQLHDTFIELEKFLQTLAVVQDQGKTAFQLTKSRFDGDTLTNPLSALYAQSHQVPEPLSSWIKSLADDTWFNLINQSRAYLNSMWESMVFKVYQNTISNRYPFDPNQPDEITMPNFEHFFATHGIINQFIREYLAPFLDMSKPQWQLKAVDNYVMPISSDMLNELIRANVITHMFFPNDGENSDIEFSLQKISLDPIVASLQLSIGDTRLQDTQSSSSLTEFHWPQANARLTLNSIEGQHFEIEELGTWALFKLLQKINVLVDEQDSRHLQIVFEINGNAGRYLLKTQSPVNPFIPGVLNEFKLNDTIV